MSESVAIEDSNLPTLDDVYAALDAEPSDAPAAPADDPPPDSPEEVEKGEADDPPAEAADPEPAPDDPATPEDPAPPTPDPDMVARLEQIAAQERQLSQRRRELDEYRARMEAQTQEFQAQQKRLQEAETWLQQLEQGDPLAALEARGYKFDDLAAGVASGRGLNPNRALEQRLAAQEAQLKAFQEQQRAAAQAQEAARRQAAARTEVASELASDPVLAAMGDEGVELVLQLAQEHVRTSGQAPSYDTLRTEARDRVFALIKRFEGVEAVKAIFAPDTASTTVPKQAATKTVSNATAAEPARRHKNNDTDLLDLPEEEQWDRLFG